MNIVFEGWYDENQEKIGQNDIWKKDDVSYTNRLDGFIVGFEPISGTDEEGLEYYYDAVRVFIYLDQDRKEVSSKEFVPWYDGEEVRNVQIPSSLQEKIEVGMKEHPIPKF